MLSEMDIRDDEFFAAFGGTINEMVVAHRRHLEINRENSNNPSKVNLRWLEATSMAAGPGLGGSMERLSILCTSAACESFFLKPASSMCFATSMR